MSGTLTFRPTCAYPWMYGRNFDLLFFFAPVLIGSALFAISQAFPVASNAVLTVILLNAFGAGPFHQGPTWFFYFDKKHRRHFASTLRNKLVFFAGPPLVMLISILLMVAAPAIGYLLTILWAVQHLIQQNLGIMLLYQNAGKGEAVLSRPLVSKSLWVPSICFFCMFLYRYLINPVLNGLVSERVLSAGGMQICQAVIFGTIGLIGLYSVFVVATCITSLQKQIKDGQALNLPALGFWALSILSFVPFGLAGRSFDEAFLIPVTIHWFQYIGLNYMLVKYKYVEAPGDNLMKASPYLLFFSTCMFLLVLGLGLNALKLSGVYPTGSLLYGIIFGIVVGLANTHYFLDAFIWRFREPYQRQEILPYLLAARQQAS